MPTPKKKPAARKGAPETRQNVLVMRTESVDVKDLQPYHQNPRIGDVPSVAKSLHINGQFKPIVVNIGTKTGRKNEILAGNHTWVAARREIDWEENGEEFHKVAWDSILASFVDVDEQAAKKIVLADNKTSDASKYDEGILAEIFQQVDDIAGTGYQSDEVEEILANMVEEIDVDAAVGQSLRAAQSMVGAIEENERRNTFEGAALGEEGDFDPDDGGDAGAYQAPEQPSVEDQPETLKGMMQFKPPEEVVFDGVGYFDIPKLDPSKLMTWDDLAPGLETWAGSATRDDDDPDRWWLYNWGIDSTSGMKDISRVIVSFYAYDNYFDNFWYYPDRYFAKIVNSKIKYLLTPNWSQSHDLPKVESLWALYRARWVGRYAQECGLKVCPDITWRDGDIDWLEKYVLATLPKGLPLIAMQLQTIDSDGVVGGIDHFKKQIKRVLEVLEPQAVLLYAGKPGRELFDQVNNTLTNPVAKVKVLETRIAKLSAHAKGREKKTTI